MPKNKAYLFMSRENSLPFALYLSFLNEHPLVDTQFQDKGVQFANRGTVAYITDCGLPEDVTKSPGRKLLGAAFLEVGSYKPKYLVGVDGKLNVVNGWYGDGLGLQAELWTLNEYLRTCQELGDNPIIVVEQHLVTSPKSLIKRILEAQKTTPVDIDITQCTYWQPTMIPGGIPPPKELVF